MDPIHPKVVGQTAGATVGGAIAVIIIYELRRQGITFPEVESDAIAFLVTTAVGAIVGWLTPSPKAGS